MLILAFGSMVIMVIKKTMAVKKIILTGYRATGKTSVGKMLARRLALDFLDTDSIIVEQEGRTINEIVARDGWGYFRAQEEKLLEALIDRQGLVVATGGGAIMHQGVWPRLMASGLVVWLTADRQTICQRLAGDDNTGGQRPALTSDDTYAEVERVLKEREPLYRQGSHLAVDTGTLDIAGVAEVIEKEFKLRA